MAQKKNAPGTQGTYAGAYIQIHHEGSNFSLNNTEYRVFSLLMQGGQLATFDIANSLNIPDPRSVIRYLRRMGIRISDIWCRGEYGVRFKRYFIHQSVQA